MYNQSNLGFQIDIIYGPSRIHLNIKLVMSYMKNEKQHWSPCIEKIMQYTKFNEVLQMLMNKWACPISNFE